MVSAAGAEAVVVVVVFVLFRMLLLSGSESLTAAEVLLWSSAPVASVRSLVLA